MLRPEGGGGWVGPADLSGEHLPVPVPFPESGTRQLDPLRFPWSGFPVRRQVPPRRPPPPARSVPFRPVPARRHAAAAAAAEPGEAPGRGSRCWRRRRRRKRPRVGGKAGRRRLLPLPGQVGPGAGVPPGGPGDHPWVAPSEPREGENLRQPVTGDGWELGGYR